MLLYHKTKSMNQTEQIYAQINMTPESKKGWKLYTFEPTQNLRQVQRGANLVLQQEFIIEWKLPKSEWRTFVGFVDEDYSRHWIDVPIVDSAEE